MPGWISEGRNFSREAARTCISRGCECDRLPGAMKCQSMPLSLHQASMALQVNSVPLSETIEPGLPRCATNSSRTLFTSLAPARAVLAAWMNGYNNVRPNSRPAASHRASLPITVFVDRNGLWRCATPAAPHPPVRPFGTNVTRTLPVGEELALTSVNLQIPADNKHQLSSICLQRMAE